MSININNVIDRITILETSNRLLTERVKQLEHQLPKYATQGQLKISESNTKNIINQNSILINNIQKQLETISIPDDSRYYLNTTEISDFRTNYQRLIAMIADAERLYQTLIAYTVQNTTP